MLVLTDPIISPFFLTVTVVSQVHAIGISTWPAYSPFPTWRSFAEERMGAMLPICGMDRVTSTSAPATGLPFASLARSRTVFMPVLLCEARGFLHPESARAPLAPPQVSQMADPSSQ